MSDIGVQVESKDLTVEELNAIKYCPNCEKPQHCDHSVTYTPQDDNGNLNLTGVQLECTKCQCMDCEV